MNASVAKLLNSVVRLMFGKYFAPFLTGGADVNVRMNGCSAALAHLG